MDGVTRGKMEEILKTWAADGYNRPELYPRHVRDAVERGIYGQPVSHRQSEINLCISILTRQQSAVPKHVMSPALHAAVPSHDQVKAALQATLQAKQRDVALNPSDQEAATQINVLIQVRSRLY